MDVLLKSWLAFCRGRSVGHITKGGKNLPIKEGEDLESIWKEVQNQGLQTDRTGFPEGSKGKNVGSETYRIAKTKFRKPWSRKKFLDV